MFNMFKKELNHISKERDVFLSSLDTLKDGSKTLDLDLLAKYD